MIAKLHNSPYVSSSFIGREEEVQGVVERVENPHCRLMTLVGLGGVGKSRLALEVVSQVRQHYIDGIYYIPLQPLTSAEHLPATIASVLDAPLAGQDTPTT